MGKANILVVDDEKDICMALNFLLTKEGYDVKEAYNGEDAIERIKQENFDVIMTDIKMEKMDGFEVLKQAQKISPETSVIMMTAFASVVSAVEAMRSGAADYITKPFINDEIRLTIRRLLQSRDLQMENQILRRELSQRPAAFTNIIGSSDAIQKVFSVMEKVIPSKSNILITGASGTGKGLVAKARRILTENIEELHRLSRGLLEHETLSGDEIRTVLRGEPVIRKVVDEPAPESRRASVPTSGRPASPTPPAGGLGPAPQPG